ncbi:nucleotidyltransferase domain-containing protein [Aromatoleum evansii]|uniref:nucleotidyltransferase domain-containing protein n=1 Tax=Aromatoleum evansii TaxID=59406 RepID=UPI00145EDB6B|nr:nucleotidyltransferase family protein [Aromatoleum evansii]NMG28756.1 hypothetical protein [Aromatoleum evansii]
MRSAACERLIAVLKTPRQAEALDLAGWSELVASARAANLAGLLAERVAAAGITAPPEAARHLEAIRQLSRRQTQSVRWEVHGLQRALCRLGIPLVLLKGAAYAVSDHPVGRGRLFGDIDILVPRHALGDVELRLMVAGWASAKTSPYDQRYYRTWMHELPPMVNLRRGTVLDVHHTILPLTSRHAPQAETIIRAASALPDLPAVRIPRPEHLLVHSIVHLLHEGELHNGLRDLFDIDGLLRAGAGEADFWPRVVEASRTLDVIAPVAFGLHLARHLLDSPIPPQVIEDLFNAAGGPASRLLTMLYTTALRPENEAAESAAATLARFAIYVRAHWLRMPPHLLLRHLAHKSIVRLRKDEPATDGRA